MLVDPAENAWLIPFAIFILPAFLSMFVGLVTLITKHLSKNSVQLVFIFPVFWVFFEWLRGNILTGFPWNIWSYSISWSIESLQILKIIGIYVQ